MELFKLFVFLWTTVLFITCQQPKKNYSNKPNADDSVEISMVLQEPVENEKLVLKNLFSPVDVEYLIDNKIAYFNSMAINPLNKITQYNESAQIALNIGVYGADLSYLWVFQQSQQGLSYLSAIQHLTDKLGIPPELVNITMESIEKNSHQTDSLIQIARNAFNSTQNFLIKSGNEESANLILLGGWIESMYIALQMYKDNNPAMASKILTQKYSLKSLMTLIEIQKTKNNILNREQLEELYHQFEKIETQFLTTEIRIDSLYKMIEVMDSGKSKIQPHLFEPLQASILKLRKKIIE